MINGLEGIPGSGKSYEATVYHVLAALQQGRLVVTNLPLVVELFAAISPDYRALIELRIRPAPVRGTWDASRVQVDLQGNMSGDAFELFEDGRVEPAPEGTATFGHVWDYYHPWKGPDGRGPLYIVDECHVPLPKLGTQRAVIEWFKLHRHFNADVLLMTQSFRDMCGEIATIIAMLIKVRKADILGRKDSYIRKVHGGYRGAEVSREERKYRPEMFRLYKSHTQGNSVTEASASDVRPFIVRFKRWTFALLALGVLLALYAIPKAVDSFKKKPPVPVAARKVVVQAKEPALPSWAAEAGVTAIAPSGKASQPVAAASAPSSELPEPMATKGLHMVGHFRGKRSDGSEMAVDMIAVSVGGTVVSHVSNADLARMGYRWSAMTECAGYLEWKNKVRAVTCDLPQQGLAVGSNATGNTQPQSTGRAPEAVASVPATLPPQAPMQGQQPPQPLPPQRSAAKPPSPAPVPAVAVSARQDGAAIGGMRSGNRSF